MSEKETQVTKLKHIDFRGNSFMSLLYKDSFNKEHVLSRFEKVEKVEIIWQSLTKILGTH